MPEKTVVPHVSIRRDPRFSLQYDWEHTVVPAIKEAQERGVLVTPLTVFDYGVIIGWYLHGWKPPPPNYIHIEPLPLDYYEDYQI